MSTQPRTAAKDSHNRRTTSPARSTCTTLAGCPPTRRRPARTAFVRGVREGEPTVEAIPARARMLDADLFQTATKGRCGLWVRPPAYRPRVEGGDELGLQHSSVLHADDSILLAEEIDQQCSGHLSARPQPREVRRRTLEERSDVGIEHTMAAVRAMNTCHGHVDTIAPYRALWGQGAVDVPTQPCSPPTGRSFTDRAQLGRSPKHDPALIQPRKHAESDSQGAVGRSSGDDNSSLTSN